ncbi:kelch-like protein 21 [Gigantopelta aegis]|uniref:kelch-like protein 21 n=1 Tax=Gigantopelta aegis TaxID=1735272 RepID=UPI001B88DE55|nr:kelch-like protein 21 [Gigantopelta aegis]
MERNSKTECWSWKIAYSVLDGLKRCYDSDAFTDTEIEVDGTNFRCHRVVLCAISDYFQAMFTSGMKESLDGKVRLAGISSKIFQDVLTFYYQGACYIIHADNVEDMLRASTLLQMKCLQNYCEDFYTDQLSVDNAVGIWKLAKCLHCECMFKKSYRFILRHFSEIFKAGEIMLLEIDELLLFLSDNDLRLPDEDAVAEIALQWIEHDFNRIVHLQQICRCLRLPLLSDDLLEKILSFVSKDKNNLLEIIEPILCERTKRSEQTSLDNVSLRNFEEVLVALGVRTTAGLQPSANAYSFIQKQWFGLEPLPFDPGVGFAVCTYENDIYVSGRSGRETYLIRYNSEINQWLDCPEMLVKRCYHEMVPDEGSLYIIGGCNKHQGALTGVDVYSVAQCSWQHFSDLLFGVYSTSAAIIGKTLLVFGGRGTLNRQTQEVQIMDIENGTASIATYLPSPTSESRTLVIEDEIFIVFTNGVIMRVFEDGSLFPYTKIPNFDRYNFGVFLHKGRLVVAGGETRYPSSTESFDDMIRVDIISDENIPKKTRTLLHTLYRKANMFGCQKILLHRAFLNLPITSEEM